MDRHDYKINFDHKLKTTIKPNYGLLVSLKKTMSCCSVIVEPKVEQCPLNTLFLMKQNGKVDLFLESTITVAIEQELFEIYPDQKNLEISLHGFLVKRPQINLPINLIEKEKCTNE